MRLAALLRAVEESPGTVTVADLARRLGETPETVRSMLAALRAAGRLGPEGSARPGTEECASAGSCSGSCPGPEDCPFVVDLGAGLEIRRRWAADFTGGQRRSGAPGRTVLRCGEE